MKIAEIRAKGKDELKELVLTSKKELFNLRMQASTGQLEKQSRFKEVRRTIARAKTIMNQPQSAEGAAKKPTAAKKPAAKKAKKEA
jgi:large subunit ribosomal protein L29